MKKTTILIILLFATVLTKAQDYQISFSGSGESTNVDSVFVENLTQGTTLALAGSDVLHLVGTVGISSQLNTDENLNIYPNPMQETSKIEVYSGKPDNVKIEVFDLNGKLIENYSGDVSTGINVFDISGFPEGFYTISISTSEWQQSSGFVSVSDASKSPAIKPGSNTIPESQTKSLVKSTKNIVEMQYNDGERLLFKGISGDYARILTIVPTQTQTIDFEFVECTDLGGNNYAVVTIGNQTWMAENLKYLPSVVGPGTGSETTPYYYVYDYNGTDVTAAKATANYDTYGVLYNWPAAMDGSSSSSSNPSGVQGVCPPGWHLPSDDEWKELEMALGMSQSEADNTSWRGTNEGSKLAGNAGLWENGDLENNAEFGTSGFTALPGGYRYTSGSFGGLTVSGHWWGATEDSGADGWSRALFYDYSSVGRNDLSKAYGFSMRCLRD